MSKTKQMYERVQAGRVTFAEFKLWFDEQTAQAWDAGYRDGQTDIALSQYSPTSAQLANGALFPQATGFGHYKLSITYENT